MAQPGGEWLVVRSRGRASATAEPPQTSPGMALILQRAGTIRYGVRAFSTLEGYAGRNRETESAFPKDLEVKIWKRPATVPVLV